jgi:hypothetical protein
MVIRPKKNSMPRRTIDLSELSRAGIRETHHTRNPAKAARTVQANKLKTTLDCVDGYHGAELVEADRHKTTFIKEWSKFRYKRIPQGYGSSGDGYTKHTDEILASCPDTPDDQDYEKTWLRKWDVQHHPSSAYFPHSNSRAEIAVKSTKRMLQDCLTKSGDIDTDKFLRAVLQYRNTPHQDCKKSPAQMVFGRALRLVCLPRVEGEAAGQVQGGGREEAGQVHQAAC